MGKLGQYQILTKCSKIQAKSKALYSVCCPPLQTASIVVIRDVHDRPTESRIYNEAVGKEGKCPFVFIRLPLCSYNTPVSHFTKI